MSEAELIAALDALTAENTQDAMALATGLIVGFLSKEGYGEVVTAWLRLRERLQTTP